MMEEDNVYKEIYVVFDLNENMYVKYLNLYEDNAYTLRAFFQHKSLEQKLMQSWNVKKLS